jgi:hypothetical protein
MKLKDKEFLDKAILSNLSGFLAGDWFQKGHDKQLVKWSVDLALETLKQRNELFFSTTPKKDKLGIEVQAVDIDYDEIIKQFNLICFMLPTVTKSTIERENAIDKILQTYSFLDIGTVFNNVVESDYLCGKKAEWKADFDWVFTPKNFIRIFEGKFKNVVNGNNNSSRTDIEIKQSANSSVNALLGDK